MSYRISDSKEIDVGQVLELFQCAPWTKDRTAEETRAVLAQSSLVVSVWEGERLVAIARVLTDYVFRAAIYDVIVRSEDQQKGIGRLLIDHLLQHPALAKIPVFNLLTRDKPLFYRKLGFVSAEEMGLYSMVLVRDEKGYPPAP
jgi:ribosomal protein S18 acetylase RimI-like enzyme